MRRAPRHGQLAEAIEQLDWADGARDRVAALTATVRGLRSRALGHARRAARARRSARRELRRKLHGARGEVAQLLGALQCASDGRPRPQTLLHPEGPLGTARSGMLLAAVTPGLAAKAAALRSRPRGGRDPAQAAGKRGTDAAGRAGRSAAGRAHRAEPGHRRPHRPATALHRGSGPHRHPDSAAAETLDGFAERAERDHRGRTQADGLPRIAARKGTLPLPVRRACPAARRAGGCGGRSAARHRARDPTARARHRAHRRHDPLSRATARLRTGDDS